MLLACEINLFVDDTALFIARREVKQAEALLNVDLNALDG